MPPQAAVAFDRELVTEPQAAQGADEEDQANVAPIYLDEFLVANVAPICLDEFLFKIYLSPLHMSAAKRMFDAKENI